MSRLVDGWSRALAVPGVSALGDGPLEDGSDVVRLLAEVGIGPGVAAAGREVLVPMNGLPAAPRDRRDEVGRRVREVLGREGALRRIDAEGEFLLDPAIRYLNHGSYGATPRVVLQAQRRFQDELEAQPMAFMAGLGPRLRAVAGRVAHRLGASVDDLVFVDNASTGVTAVLRSFDFQPGDAILTTNHAYAAVRKAVDFVARRAGVRVDLAPVPWPLERLDDVVDAVKAAWRPEARVAVLDLMSSVSATRMPLEELIAWLQARGTRVLVDAAHMPGHLPLDLDALGADWCTGNLHKWWFTPKGCAVLHARADAREHLAPLVISHGQGQGFPAAFEQQGTRDPSAWLAADAALDFVDRMGGDDVVRAHNVHLAHRGAEVVADALNSRWLTPSHACAALVPVEVPNVPPTLEACSDLVERVLRRHRLQTWIMPLEGVVGVRVCAQIYNRPEDYVRLAEALVAETT